MGFSVITGDPFGTVMHADNASFDGTKRSGVLNTDGQLWIGASSGARVRRGALSSTGGTIAITVGPGTINLEAGGSVATTYVANTGSATPVAGILNVLGLAETTTNASGNTVNIFSPRVARFVVDPVVNRGTNQTIQSAINAASSGDTIFIRPGTYTENLTLKAGVNITSFEGDGFTPNVTIVGTCTFTAAGSVSISGIRLQTNSGFALAVTGSAASMVNLIDCYLNFTNNTGISFTSSSSSSQVQLINCQANLGTTGIAFFAGSTAGQLNIIGGLYGNAPGSTTANTWASTGFLLMQYVGNFNSPITISDTAGGNFYYTRFNGEATNTTAFTHNSTNASPLSIYFCYFGSGSQPAISIGAGASLQLNSCTIVSTNTNAIAGSGTLTYTNLYFTSTSKNIQSTITQTPALQGTFTPGIAFGGGTTGITYGTQTGKYVREGNRIDFQILIVLTNKGSSTGTATITGLPIATGANGTLNVNLLTFQSLTLTVNYTAALMQNNNSATTATLFQQGSGVNLAAITDTNFANATLIAATGFYLIN